MTRLTDAELAEIDRRLREDVTFCRTALPDTLKRLVAEVCFLRAAIREHRDQRGDDRCWMDDEKLYQSLPEGYPVPERGVAVELALCEKFIACRRHPGTEYVSPQRRIEELEAEVVRVFITKSASVRDYSLEWRTVSHRCPATWTSRAVMNRG